MTETDAPEILSNVPGSFPWGVLHERHPALLRQIRDAFPLPPERRAALDRFEEETASGVIEPLSPAAHDRELWFAWGRGRFRRRWPDVPFLWAESYFYRKLLAALGYFEPGPWHAVDPFEPFKRAELRDESVDEQLAALDDDPGEPALLQASLWGNRADLGFRLSAGGAADDPTAGLVVDDGAAVWSLLDGAAPGRVCVVADNAGRELLPDLVLVDHLLRTGRAAEAVLHVKPYPYYISDATTPDVLAALRRLTAAPGRAAEIGRRLWEAMGTGRLAVRAHTFSCAPLPYADMPDDLRGDFAAATLTIMKGDLNYRRLVGDRAWPATTPFAALTAYFPGPVTALRTLKSDVVTGLDGPALAALDATGRPWRTSGTHALIQTRP